jgi:hypothetical protein
MAQAIRGASTYDAERPDRFGGKAEMQAQLFAKTEYLC